MTKEDGKGRWGYKKESDPKRISLFCPESSCKFSLEQSGELPVRVVDEELYSNAPTLLFGTVDKFAQIPWREEVSTFFGLDSDNLNPELIIQDELHLISGPLGSIVGMYEMLLDEMCSADGISPKIISSTATSRRAGEQCAALYNRDVQQFPPPGLEASDSFFFREEDVDEIPGRLYLGIMSSCKTQTTTEIRAMGRLLQSIGNMDAPDEVKDHFWTLVNYFNSLRELGHCVTLLNDDIRSFIRALQNREGKPGRKLTDHLELTSRVDSEDIPDHLSQLEVPYDSDNPHAASDVALASNMISVGLDVSRLGLMTVIGQPKTTSEYIQATSRVGRDHPGLVVTLFDGARSRDRSHYEHFKDYHQAFYRYVEPSSVTPFSRSVRERALQSVVISLVRHFQGLEDNQKASEINQTDIDFEEIESTIMDRVKEVSKKRGIPLTEEDRKKIASEIDDIFTHWQNLANEHEELVYRDWSDFRGGRKSNPPLLTMRGKDNPIVEDHDAPVDSFEALLSMRNVDVGTKIRILE